MWKFNIFAYKKLTTAIQYSKNIPVVTFYPREKRRAYMAFLKNKRKQPHQQETTVQQQFDSGELLHQSYMLVRHLLSQYPEIAGDEELVVRMSRLFEGMFPDQTLNRLIEALTCPFVQRTDEALSPSTPEQVILQPLTHNNLSAEYR